MVLMGASKYFEVLLGTARYIEVLLGLLASSDGKGKGGMEL